MTGDALEASLVKTIADSDLSSLAADIGDEALDQVLDDAPIPILSTIRKLNRGLNSVRDYLYTKKVLRFLRELAQIPSEERAAKVAELYTNIKERKKFGEHLALLLDRMNEMDKAQMMGRIAAAHIKGKITFNQLRSLNYALDAFDLRQQVFLQDFYKRKLSHAYGNQFLPLAMSGLLEAILDIQTSDPFSTPPEAAPAVTDASLIFGGTDLGELFVDICFEAAR